MSKILMRMSIGSNNETGVLHFEEIQNLMAGRYPLGCRCWKIKGVWQGGREDAAIAEVSMDDYPQVRVNFYQVACSMCVLLEQKSIMVESFSKDGYDCDFVTAEG